MTTITIRVKKPENFANLHGAIKAIPFGLATESGAIPEGNDVMAVYIKAKKKNDGFNAATNFMDAFDGHIFSCEEKTGKKTFNLMESLN